MLERLSEHRVFKPWGRTDIPEQFGGATDEPLGEIWFQRQDGHADALLVKYLFTSERLSVQVHPDDAAARAAGHSRGKDEAWVVLDADPDARIGIGLKEPVSATELRAAALDGSISQMLDWRTVEAGDAYYSPAGTLHSIGGGLTLLEIQQNCDITYRLYDFGRPRELHLDQGVAAALTDVDVRKSVERPMGEGRSIVAQGPKFTLERCRADTRLDASVSKPLWLIPMGGDVRANGTQLADASVWFADEPLELKIEDAGELLIAYESSSARSGG
jgi:mannose-6-phosphate isomerase